MGKDSFIMYDSFYAPLSDLSHEQLGRLFEAIFLYRLKGISEVASDIRMAFLFIKNQLDIDSQKYQDKVKKLSASGLKGRMAKASKCQQMPANANICQQKLAVNVNDNENVNVNDNVLKKDTTDVVSKEVSTAVAVSTVTDKEMILSKKMEAFSGAIKLFIGTYGVEMCEAFYDYWSEPNKSRTKMRWETEKTWDLSRRLRRWSENNYGYTNHTPTQSTTKKTDGYVDSIQKSLAISLSKERNK